MCIQRLGLEENKGLGEDVGLNGRTQRKREGGGGELSTIFLKNGFPSFQYHINDFCPKKIAYS